MIPLYHVHDTASRMFTCPPSDMVPGVLVRWCGAGVRGCRLPHLPVEGKLHPPNFLHGSLVSCYGDHTCCHGNQMHVGCDGESGG